MPANPNIPPGFVRMQAGEIITADTYFWTHGVGPWTRYGSADGETASEIGDHVQEDQYLCIRRETHAEFLQRTGFDPRLVAPPTGVRWLESGEVIPQGAQCVGRASAFSSLSDVLSHSMTTCRAGERHTFRLDDFYFVPLALEDRRPSAVLSRRPPGNIRKARVSVLPLP